MVTTTTTNKKKGSRRRLVIILLVSAAVLVAGGVYLRSRAVRFAALSASPPETVILGKSDMVSYLSVSGVVESGSVTNIYSTLSYPVQEIFVSVGDRVSVGDVLAVLDTTNLEYDIAQAELNHMNAQASAAEERRTINSGVTNAQTQLESSRLALERQQLSLARVEKDLEDALLDAEEPFDSYRYDLTIDDAFITLERREEDMKKANDDYQKALNNFDDYAYRHAINEARIALERRRADAITAENDLADERSGNRSAASNTTAYQNAVYAAEAEFRNWEDAYDAAYRAYNAARQDPDFSDDALALLADDVRTAQAGLSAAQSALTRAYNELNQTSDNYSIQMQTAIRNAERALENAKRAREDAQRAYDKAVTDLERARNDAVDAYLTSLERAQNAYADAERMYQNALNDKERAIDDYIKNNETRVTNAHNALADSMNQIQSAENSVANAQNSLSQASSRPVTSNTNVQVQELNLERLHNSLANGTIVATADGVITESNIRVGAAPSGILFVIEDTDDLYVSARVREYNLSTVSVGLDTEVSTDATGNTIYAGELTYISPKAVSPAGSTSVEFEVKAKLHSPDGSIRIGMNAFLSIIMETRSDVYSVPASVVVVRDDGEFVYAYMDSERVEIPVATGLRTSTNTEIASIDLFDGIELLMDPENRLSSGTANLPFWMR